MKEQFQRDSDWNRKQGYASNSSLTPPQMIERNNVMRDFFPSKPDQPEANAARPKAGWSFGGELNFGRGFPKDGPNDVSGELKATYGNEEVLKKLEEEEEKNKMTSPNGNGEEQKPRSNR